MFGNKAPEELNTRLTRELGERHRTEQLASDPSDIPGMTQTELNAVIDTGTIPAALLRSIL